MSIKEVISYSYHVRSSQRNSGTPTDLNITLKNVLTLLSKNGMFQIRVNNVQIPYSFYEFTTEFNSFNVIFTDILGNIKNSTITLQAGNYNANSILSELQSKIIQDAQISVPPYTGFTPVLNFYYDSTLSKAVLTMSNPALASIQIQFSNNPIGSSFFGFSVNAIISSLQTAIGDKVMITNPVSYLLLRCSTLRQLKNSEWIVEKDVFSDIVYKIPILTGQNTWIQSSDMSDWIYVLNDNISSLNFYLTNNLTFTPIDLQGLEWSFSFEIKEVQRESYLEKTLAINNFQNQETSEIKEEPQEIPEDVKNLQNSIQNELDRLDRYQKKLQKYNKK